MDPDPTTLGEVAGTSRRLARRLLTIGANRIELLMVEVQEERERLVLAILLALGAAALGLMAVIALTGALVVLLWPHHPAGVLFILALSYGGGAALLYRKLSGLLRDWSSFSATLDQLRKDRALLEKDVL